MANIPLRDCSTTWTLSAFTDEAGDAADVQIAAARRAGLRRIDLRGIDGYNIAALPLDRAAAIRQKLETAGLGVQMFGSPIGKIDLADDFAGDLERLRHLGRLRDVLGCNAVRIFSYFNAKSRLPEARWRQESVDRLRRLRDLAGELGLVLYHENESEIFGDTSEHVSIIAEALRERVPPGTPPPPGSFRMIFDPDNYVRTGQNVWEIWLAQRDTTDAFHLKDSTAAGTHMPVGQGAGFVREILADALARGWHGPLSLEPHLQHSPAVMATGPSGQANQRFADMSAPDAFHAAAQAALALLAEVKAPVA